MFGWLLISVSEYISCISPRKLVAVLDVIRGADFKSYVGFLKGAIPAFTRELHRLRVALGPALTVANRLCSLLSTSSQNEKKPEIGEISNRRRTEGQADGRDGRRHRRNAIELSTSVTAPRRRTRVRALARSHFGQQRPSGLDSKSRATEASHRAMDGTVGAFPAENPSILQTRLARPAVAPSPRLQGVRSFSLITLDILSFQVRNLPQQLC